MGRKKKLPVRIVALRIPPDVAQERKTKERNNRDKRKKHSDDYMSTLDWSILITNMDKKQLPVGQAMRIYGLRWRIETIFKVWKSKMKCSQLFAQQHFDLTSRVFIQLHLVLMTHVLFTARTYSDWALLVFYHAGKVLSIMKFIDFLKDNNQLLETENILDQQFILEYLAYYCCYDKRKDRSNFFESLYDKKLS